MSAAQQIIAALRSAEVRGIDPGAGGKILTPYNPTHIGLRSAAAEARTLADPDRPGLSLVLTMIVDGGDITLTPENAIDAAGIATTIVFSAVGEMVVLDSFETAPGTYRWRLRQAYGTNLSGALRYGTLTAASALTVAQLNKVYYLNSATEFATTLPPVASSAGCWVEFIVKAAPSGASYTVITDSSENKILGHVLTSDLDGAADADSETSGGDTLTFVDGVAVVGDKVRLECDGANWYAVGSSKIYNAITITTAS